MHLGRLGSAHSLQNESNVNPLHLQRITSKILLLHPTTKQLSWEQPVQNYVILTGISEQHDLRKGILK